MPTAIKSICTTGGTPVSNPSELEDGGTYVAVDGTFKRIEYRANGASQRRRASTPPQRRPPTTTAAGARRQARTAPKARKASGGDAKPQQPADPASAASVARNKTAAGKADSYAEQHAALEVLASQTKAGAAARKELFHAINIEDDQMKHLLSLEECFEAIRTKWPGFCNLSCPCTL